MLHNNVLVWSGITMWRGCCVNSKEWCSNHFRYRGIMNNFVGAGPRGIHICLAYQPCTFLYSEESILKYLGSQTSDTWTQKCDLCTWKNICYLNVRTHMVVNKGTPPSLLPPPISHLVMVVRTTTFSCILSGFPFQWYQRGLLVVKISLKGRMLW